ncbi:MAG: ribosome-binding factor A [Byssovorax sp.]
MSKRESRRGDRSPAEASVSFEEEGDDGSPQAAGHRHARLQQILLEELGALVRDELSDPKLDGVMVTAVELSVDYRNARVRFWGPRATTPTREERERLESAIARAAPFLRASLADSVDLKQVPTLNFLWDRGADERPGGHEEALSSR